MRVIRIVMVMVVALVLIGAASTAGYCIEITEINVLKNGNPVVFRGATSWGSGDQVKVRITVKGRNETAFVAATVVDSKGNELDFRGVLEAKLGSNMFGGPVTKTYTLSEIIPVGKFVEGSGLRIIVRLWERVVLRRNCQRIDPSDGLRPGKFCRRNGFHMEGPIGGSFEARIGFVLALEGYGDWSP